MDLFGHHDETTPAEKQLRPILCDERIQVLSNFELNQVASLTYNDLSCDGIFELIEQIVRKPLDYTPLTVQKALIVTRHVMVYGSEKTVNHAYGLGDFIKALLEFNTVLLRQKQGGPMSFFQNLQGGGVDKGGPVREAAGEVTKLLGNIDELQKLRVSSASGESLVPVGDDKVAFVTDEVRLHVLKSKIEEEKRIRIQSNLKKSDGGFGGGYASKDGKTVVGAAHGIDAMIKMAGIQKIGFSDDAARGKSREVLILEELKAQDDAEKAARAADAARANAPPAVDDLLGFSRDADLMDFSEPVPSANQLRAAATGDLLGGTTTASAGGGGLPAAAADDPFGLTSAYRATTTPARSGAATLPSLASSSLLDFSVQNDPFAPVPSKPNPPSNNSAAAAAADPMSLLSMTMDNSTTATTSNSKAADPMSLLTMTMDTATTTITNNPLASMMQQTIPSPGVASGAMAGLASGLVSMSLSGAPPSASPAPVSSEPPKKPVMASNEDRFSALDALAATATNVSRATALAAKEAENRLLGFSAPPPSDSAAPMGGGFVAVAPAVPENMIAPGTGKIASAYGADDNDDGDNPWVMGGSTGMGLEPVGPVPSAPPPPPPPDF